MTWSDPIPVAVDGNADPARLLPDGTKWGDDAMLFFQVPEAPPLVFGGPGVTFATGVPLVAGDLFIVDLEDGPPFVQVDAAQMVTLNVTIKGVVS